jgi:hypothetical protein
VSNTVYFRATKGKPVYAPFTQEHFFRVRPNLSHGFLRNEAVLKMAKPLHGRERLFIGGAAVSPGLSVASDEDPIRW